MWSKAELKLLFFSWLKKELWGRWLLQLVASLLGFPLCPVGRETKISQFLVPYGHYQGMAICLRLKLALWVLPFHSYWETGVLGCSVSLHHPVVICGVFCIDQWGSLAKNGRDYQKGRSGWASFPLEPTCNCILWSINLMNLNSCLQSLFGNKWMHLFGPHGD